MKEKRLSWIFVALVVGISLVIIMRPTTLKKERKAKTFLEKVLASTNDGTDFYKKHSSANAISDIEEHKTKISKNYIIEVFDNEGPFEYFVTFDKKYTFDVVINYPGKGITLHKFEFVPGRVGYRLDLSD